MWGTANAYEGKAQRVEVRGELAAILGLASGGRSGSVLAEQVKLVAGTGFEPVTFRL